MTGVLGRPYLVRQDLAISTGVDQRIGYRWRQGPSAQSATGVDLYGFEAVAAFASLASEPWLETAPLLHEDGLVELVIPATATVGPEWGSRYQGTYRINLTSPEGAVTPLACGFVTIVNGGPL